MLVTNFLERKVLESSISILSPQCPIGDPAARTPPMLLLTQDIHNTVVQLFTVTHVRAQNFVHPHLLLVDDLLSGPLSSLNLKLLHWSTHPDSKQGLATPPVELLLSNLIYLVGAAKVVADDVEEDKSFWS